MASMQTTLSELLLYIGELYVAKRRAEKDADLHARLFQTFAAKAEAAKQAEGAAPGEGAARAEAAA